MIQRRTIKLEYETYRKRTYWPGYQGTGKRRFPSRWERNPYVISPSSSQINLPFLLVDKLLTGIGTPHPPNRPHPPHRSPQDPPSPLATTPKRESPLLVRRHGSHHRAAVLASHHPETGTRREAEGEGEGEGGERGRVEAEVFCWCRDAAWEAGVDGGGQDGVRRVTGGSVGVGGE